MDLNNTMNTTTIKEIKPKIFDNTYRIVCKKGIRFLDLPVFEETEIPKVGQKFKYKIYLNNEPGKEELNESTMLMNGTVYKIIADQIQVSFGGYISIIDKNTGDTPKINDKLSLLLSF